MASPALVEALASNLMGNPGYGPDCIAQSAPCITHASWALQAIGCAGSPEDLLSLALPTSRFSLSGMEHLLVVANRERVVTGRFQFPFAIAATDPDGTQGTADRSYVFVRGDGLGGGDGDCAPASASGSWCKSEHIAWSSGKSGSGNQCPSREMAICTASAPAKAAAR